GAVGELVIRKPWPGMTRGFWRDPERYLTTYWRRLPDVWVHGDWARIDTDGFWYIEGRSDDTLKVAGKRVGPAEVESAATAHPAGEMPARPPQRLRAGDGSGSRPRSASVLRSPTGPSAGSRTRSSSPSSGSWSCSSPGSSSGGAPRR